MGARRRLAQALGVAKALALGGKLLFLGRLGGDGLDLGELVAEEVQVALAGAVALAQFLQLSGEADALAVRLAIALPRLQVLRAGEAVEHLGLRRGDRQLAVLVLSVEGEQPTAEQLQIGGRSGAAGEEGAGPPARRDPPPEDDLLGAGRQPLGDLRHLRLAEQAGGKVEDPLNPGLLGAGPDDLGSRLAAHQEVERVGKNRLPGAGLAGDRVEPFAEAQLRSFDQQEVLDAELA